MTERINAIDAARGLCLVNIFVNHITLGALTEASPSKIAFFDSADLFVLLAGISSFLAYGGRAGVFDPGTATARMWRRALTLYYFNLLIMAASFLVVLVGDVGAGPPNPNIAPPAMSGRDGAFEHLWLAVSMQQSIGYSMVLRLYVFLMLVAPLYIWLASKRFWFPLPVAGAIWLVSGHFGLVLSNRLSGDMFSMTLLPWQLVFAAGVSLSAAISQGVKLPRSRLLIRAAALVVFGGTFLLVAGDQLSPQIHAWLETRNDHFWTGISKSFQSPLRLIYLFSLVYLVVALPKAPIIRLLHQAKPGSLLCRLGRRSLPIFAFGAVFAMAIDQLLWNLIVTGLAGQGSVAAVLLEVSLAAVGLWFMVRIADRGGQRGAPTTVPSPRMAEVSAAGG